jgi:hypothetical protein
MDSKSFLNSQLCVTRGVGDRFLLYLTRLLPTGLDGYYGMWICSLILEIFFLLMSDMMLRGGRIF